jgi:hypothetical protein
VVFKLFNLPDPSSRGFKLEVLDTSSDNIVSRESGTVGTAAAIHSLKLINIF